MAIAYVQSRSVDSGAVSSATLAYSSNTTAGSLLIVAVRQSGTGGTCTISDSQSNTYVNNAINSTFTSDKLFVAYALNTTGGANTVTCTFGASVAMRWAIHEYSGLASSSALDQSNVTTGNNTAPDSGNITTTVANELLFSACGCGANSTFTVGANYTLREQIPAGANGKLATEDRIVSATGTYSAPYTISGTTTWGDAILSFKIASSSATVFKMAGSGGGFAGEKIGFVG